MAWPQPGQPRPVLQEEAQAVEVGAGQLLSAEWDQPASDAGAEGQAAGGGDEAGGNSRDGEQQQQRLQGCAPVVEAAVGPELGEAPGAAPAPGADAASAPAGLNGTGPYMPHAAAEAETGTATEAQSNGTGPGEPHAAAEADTAPDTAPGQGNSESQAAGEEDDGYRKDANEVRAGCYVCMPHACLHNVSDFAPVPHTSPDAPRTCGHATWLNTLLIMCIAP